MALVDEKIEQDLELIGSTAIEDKLQDQVPDTIQFMKEAGIKVWVLTGDKTETAINIGVAAGLLDPQMEQHLLYEHQLLDQGLEEYFNNVLLKLRNSHASKTALREKHALIIPGIVVTQIELDKDLLDVFLQCADLLDVVLACRVSPKQKADIVNIIKRRHPNKTTLAIGDGANDVNMILQAHVGIGITGKEG